MRTVLPLAVVWILLAPAKATVAQTPTDSTMVQDTASACPDSAGTGVSPLDRVFDQAMLRLGLGRATYRGDVQFPESTGRAVYHVGVTASFRAIPYLALDVDWGGGSRTFDTETAGSFGWLGSVDDESTLTVQWVTLGLRFVPPPFGPVHPYATGGLTVAFQEIRTEGTLVGFPTTARTDTDETLVPVVGVGVQAVFGTWGVYVDYRRIDSRADFADYGIRSARTGGTYVVAGLAYYPAMAER